MTMRAKVLFVLALVISAISITTLPADAWYTQLRPGQSPTHYFLAELSSNALHHFNLYNHDAIFKGSNEPDDHGLQDHTASKRRSSQSFDAAAKKCAKGDNYWAIRRLARSFHYLQDYGDPTDYLRGGRKDYVRQKAHEMLARGQYVVSNNYWLNSYRHFFGQVANRNLQETLDYANSEAKQIGREINSIYDLWYQRGRRQNEVNQRDGAVRQKLLASFGLLAACQDRVVELFDQRCKELGEGPPIVAPPRPTPQPNFDYPSEAAPRPPVRR
jgi:hypothetical protein